MPVEMGGGLHRRNFIPKVAVGHAIERPNIYHSRLCENFGVMLLRQVKVVLVERVLGAVAATHHAAAAGHAGRPLRAFSAEIWIRKRLATRLVFRRLEDSDIRPVERVSDSCSLGNLLQPMVRRSKDLVLRDPP